MYEKILIRFGELSTKGKNKMSFVRQLERNIKKLMNVEPEVLYDRMFIPYSKKNIEELNYLFGIQSYSPVVVLNHDLETIKEKSISLIKKNGLENKTFKVETKRHWKQYEMKSNDFSRMMGSFIQDKLKMKVDVKNPDLKVEFEIREKNIFIFIKRINGLGGYPTGINGKVLHLMSGGIDSPVAAYKLMKRGLHVDYLNFVTPPMTNNETEEKVNKIIKLLVKYQGKCKLYRSNFTKLMLLEENTSNISYKITLMRRSFYRIATKLVLNHNYLAIANGENLGQVASQTPESIFVISQVTNFPIYRPLLTFDKLETIKLAKKIGTYELSIIEVKQTCEMFAPKAPIIKPKLDVVENLEKELGHIDKFENEIVDNNIEINYFIK